MIFNKLNLKELKKHIKNKYYLPKSNIKHKIIHYFGTKFDSI